ncbi:ABC transporter ATP-binding protein [Neobacillus niacini]|uniref:ABC transporter ATP-binding protein n=1 Tax=Neobacillus niacini TaxID=86668 RepID=UPI0005EFFBF8|nr:ABC transporter ATP-binding protein [Neobacillus niacini]
MTGSNHLLDVYNIKVTFKGDDGAVNALENVSFHIEKGEILGIVGESGCGKSVTSLSIMRLLGQKGRITEGEISFKGKALTSLSEYEMQKIRGNEISMIFQEPMTSLNPVFTLGNQMIETIRLHLKLSKKEARKLAIDMLKKVGIPRAETIIDDYPHALSGGMRQRVMIAMALVCQPSLLIADEPTTALDVTIQAQILDLMKKLIQESDASIMLITHDLGVIAEMADRVIVMYAGQIIEDADVYTLFDNPKHPYTQGLLRSIPHMDGDEVERLESIPGSVPSLQNMPKGCRFSTRCAYVTEKCLTESPELLSLSRGHSARCWLLTKDNAGDVSEFHQVFI